MGSLYSAMIPAFYKEFAGNADANFMASGSAPVGARQVVGFYVNDTTSGTSVSLDVRPSLTVVFDNLVEGSIIPGNFTGINNTGTTADSIIVAYI